MSTYDAINAAYGAGSATDLALQYRKKAREDQYKQDVGTFIKVRLDEANQAAAAAAAAKDAEVQSTAQELADTETRLANELESLQRGVIDNQREATIKAARSSGMTEDQIADVLKRGDAVSNAAEAKQLIDSTINPAMLKGATVTGRAAQSAFFEYLTNPQRKAFSASGEKTEVRGAVNPKILAEAYKKKIIDTTPDYMDAGDSAYLQSLRGSEGDRAAIEAMLPKGTDAIDAAQAAAQKRITDRYIKAQTPAMMQQNALIAASTDKSMSREGQWDMNLAMQKIKDDANMARTKARVGGMLAAHGMDNAARERVAIYVQNMQTGRSQDGLSTAIMTNPTILAMPEFQAKLGKMLGLNPSQWKIAAQAMAAEMSPGFNQGAPSTTFGVTNVPGTPGKFGGLIGGTAPTTVLGQNPYAGSEIGAGKYLKHGRKPIKAPTGPRGESFVSGKGITYVWDSSSQQYKAK